jgi:hypothetical protein
VLRRRPDSVFNFDSEKKELTKVVWKASSKGVSPQPHQLSQGSCLCLLLDLSNANGAKMPSWAYRDGSASRLTVGTQVVITEEAPDISGAYIGECEQYVGKQGTVKKVETFTDPRDANTEKDGIIVTMQESSDDIFVFAGAIRPLEKKTGGTLKLLLREGDHGDETEEIARIEGIPPGRKLVPYFVWINGSTGSASADKPVRIRTLWGANAAMLTKQKDYNPIEAKGCTERAKNAILRARQLQMRRQRSEQHMAIRMRPALWGIGVDKAALLSEASCDRVSLRLDGKNALQIAEGGDQRPVRLRTGRWWYEVELTEISNSHQTGTLRLGYLGDKLAKNEWAGFEILLPSGGATSCGWGGKPGQTESTGLVFGAKNRVALELTFPEGAAGGRPLERPTPSWTERGGSFDGPDQLQKGTRVVVIPDVALIRHIMEREGATIDENGIAVTGWTVSHEFHLPAIRTGEVVSLEAPRTDLPPTRLARGSRVVGCLVKMDAPKTSRHPERRNTAAPALAERNDQGESQSNAAPAAVYLRFSPGCLLDETTAGAKDQRATLSMVFRSGDGAVRSHRCAVRLPAGLPLKPFVEWQPSGAAGTAGDESASSQPAPMQLGMVFGEKQFELNKDHKSRLLLPIVVDVVARALQQTEAEFSWRNVLAAQWIRDAFVRKLRTKVSTRREHNALPQQGDSAGLSEGREHWSNVMDRMRFIWGSAAKAQGARQPKQVKDVRGNMSCVLQRQKSKASLVYTGQDGELRLGLEPRELLREMTRTGLSAANASRKLETSRDNVGRMLRQFEEGRLAAGGSFDECLLMDNSGHADHSACEALDGEAGASEFASNEELHRSSKKSVYSIRMGADLGDLSLPPPQVDPSKWLVDCVRLFREELDLRLNETIPKPQPFLAKLITVVRSRAQFIDDQNVSLEAVRSVLQEVNRGDRSGGSDKRSGRRTNFDSEMVQEQQAEKEKAKEKESEQIYQVEHENAPRDDRPWKLRDLETGREGRLGRSTARGLIDNQFKPLSEFKMVSKSKTLQFPSYMLATENHVYYQADVTHSRRLKNVEVLMQWIPQLNEVEDDDVGGETKGMHVVVLSLREAQTLRRAMQAKSENLSWLPTSTFAPAHKLVHFSFVSLAETLKDQRSCLSCGSDALRRGEPRACADGHVPPAPARGRRQGEQDAQAARARLLVRALLRRQLLLRAARAHEAAGRHPCRARLGASPLFRGQLPP